LGKCFLPAKRYIILWNTLAYSKILKATAPK
jgi:hypothetical protein